MANGHGTETPANKIATAQSTLQLAIRLCSEINAGRIGPDIYSREVAIITGGAGVRVPPFREGSVQDLQSGSFNLVLTALSASALTTDETLDEVFGKVFDDTDQTRSGIRVIVNQLRNAFAHNPWRPRWRVYPKYRNVYPLVLSGGAAFTFDATALDGDGVKPEQIGGLEFWVKLLQHCEGLVAL